MCVVFKNSAMLQGNTTNPGAGNSVIHIAVNLIEIYQLVVFAAKLM